MGVCLAVCTASAVLRLAGILYVRTLIGRLKCFVTHRTVDKINRFLQYCITDGLEFPSTTSYIVFHLSSPRPSPLCTAGHQADRGQRAGFSGGADGRGEREGGRGISDVPVEPGA